MALYSVCRFWLFLLVINEAMFIVMGSLVTTFLTVRLGDSVGSRLRSSETVEESAERTAVEGNKPPLVIDLSLLLVERGHGSNHAHRLVESSPCRCTVAVEEFCQPIAVRSSLL